VNTGTKVLVHVPGSLAFATAVRETDRRDG
jgi:hypothetical protein